MKKVHFENIDVEKLNIVEKDGEIKMTLFNSDNIPPAIMDGKIFCQAIDKIGQFRELFFIMAKAMNVVV